MKKVLAVLLLMAAIVSCETDNSSTVSFVVDGEGCFVRAGDFDSESRVTSVDGVVTLVYVWECGTFFDEEQGLDIKEKQVTLIFEGTTCLELSATMVEEGRCKQGKTPVL